MEKVTRFDQLHEGLDVAIECGRCGELHQLRLVELKRFTASCTCGACNDGGLCWTTDKSPHPELGPVCFVSHIDIDAGVVWRFLAKPSPPATA